MNEKKFLQQVYTKLENQLEQEVKLADDSIEISEGDKVIFKIDSKGDVLYSADKQFSNIVNKLHGKIENDVRNTKEFLKVMDNRSSERHILRQCISGGIPVRWKMLISLK